MWTYLLVIAATLILTLALVSLVLKADGRSMRPVLLGVGATLGTLLVAWVLVQCLFTYNRAVNGDRAWTCLTTPGCVARSLSVK